MSSSSAQQAVHVVEDCHGIVQLLSDGTVRRSTDYSALPLLGDVPSDLPVEWKDVVYDATHALRLRVYRPTAAGEGDKKKLPVLVYFHGGGFCIASYELPKFHSGALRLASELPALVVSADYRLAPEHRLPAAHEDAESVLSWLGAQAAAAGADEAADPWLAESADFHRVFVCGDSAGGNISHHVAMQRGLGRLRTGPALRLAGCVLLWPFFAGEERTPSEAAASTRDADEDFLGTAAFDRLWRLALPVGATRDHPTANPFGPGSVPLREAAAFPPVLVVDPDQDLLHDRIVDYVARLKAAGKTVELVTFQGQGHGFFVFEPWGEASDELVGVIRRFVHGG